jgi:uncharacterized protein (TIGR03437 family)
VENGASFVPSIVPNAWLTIKGTDLSPTTDNWSNSIVNGQLPIQLDGVSVSVGGKAAYIYYISPTQINVMAPDAGLGPLAVTVMTPTGTSAAVTATSQQYGPAFFVWPNNQAVATRTDYSLAVKAGTFNGLTTTAAKPGDVIILWGTGFGPTNPASPVGVPIPSTQTYNIAGNVTVSLNGAPVTVYASAMSPGNAGLVQVAIQVPASTPNGDWPIIASVGGVSSPTGIVLSVHN